MNGKGKLGSKLLGLLMSEMNGQRFNFFLGYDNF